MIPRIYTTELLAENSSITLTDQPYNHLIRVLRLQVGDPIVLFNGQKGEYQATIEMIAKKSVMVRVLKFSPTECESKLDIHIGQGLARLDKMDFVIQKAVELGANQITPLLTKNCQTKIKPERLENKLMHWQRVVSSACEQCGRNQLPQVTIPQHLDSWCSASNTDLALVLDPKSPTSLQEVIAQTSTMPQTIRILVGPESGLTPSEIALSELHHFIPVNLGPRMLRTETAALNVVSILQYIWE